MDTDKKPSSPSSLSASSSSRARVRAFDAGSRESIIICFSIVLFFFLYNDNLLAWSLWWSAVVSATVPFLLMEGVAGVRSVLELLTRTARVNFATSPVHAVVDSHSSDQPPLAHPPPPLLTERVATVNSPATLGTHSGSVTPRTPPTPRMPGAMAERLDSDPLYLDSPGTRPRTSPSVGTVRRTRGAGVDAVASRRELSDVELAGILSDLESKFERYGDTWDISGHPGILPDLVAALRHTSLVRKVFLQGMTMTASVIAGICDELGRNSSVEILNMERLQLTDKGIAEVAAMLKKNQSIRELHLGATYLTAEGCGKLSEALVEHTSLTHLLVPGNRITNSGMELLLRALAHSTNLRKLDLQATNINAEGCEVLGSFLQQTRSLATLSISLNRNIGELGLVRIAEALTVNQSLTCLNALECGFNASAARALAEVLKTNTTLRELYIADNDLNADGGAALADMLCVNSTLKTLDISVTNLQAQGASAIADALAVNRSLTVLVMDENKLGDSGADAMARAVSSNDFLRELRLRNNKFGPDGGIAILQATAHHPSLMKLELSDNVMGSRVVESVVRILRENKLMTELGLNRVGFVPQDLQSISHALVENMTLLQMPIRQDYFSDDTPNFLAEMVAMNDEVKLVLLVQVLLTEEYTGAMSPREDTPSLAVDASGQHIIRELLHILQEHTQRLKFNRSEAGRRRLALLSRHAQAPL